MMIRAGSEHVQPFRRHQALKYSRTHFFMYVYIYVYINEKNKYNFYLKGKKFVTEKKA